ncbi:MAG TPA: DUF302 domain-containing protein [Acidimicrobiia bacterium]|nr:DUF302 domain-containing protein [Acidimicrobiia bacterium]
MATRGGYAVFLRAAGDDIIVAPASDGGAVTLHGAGTTDGVVTIASPRSAAETLERLSGLLEEKGLKRFAVVDHSGAAEAVGLEMPDTKLVLFGSPAAGTPVMVAAPLAALDLPLKILVSGDGAGGVWVSYNSPDYLAARHRLSHELRDRLQGVEAIAHATVAP